MEAVPPRAGALIASWVEHDAHRAHDLLAAFDEDQLRAVLVQSLTVLDEFVQQVAEHHSVSTRAVLRSMGIEPAVPAPR